MEYHEEELLVCLNFDDKIDQHFFKKPNIFFNAINLDTQRPLIQIDRHVFQGSYEDCMGTNVFLEEISEPRSVDRVFQTQTPMHLEYLNSSAKILNLKWINVPEEVKTLKTAECVNVRFLEDYQTVLDKIENGSLDIQDAITRMQSPNIANKVPSEDSGQMQNNVETSKDEMFQTIEVKEEPIPNQDLLRRLIQPASKKDDESSCEIVADHLFDIENCESFSILKQLYLNHLKKESIVLNDLTLNLANAKIFNLVNVQKSIDDGIIAQSKVNDEMSEADKQALFSIRNFDNLSLPVKFVILTEYLSECKKQLQKLSEDDLNVVDKFNRTPKQRYKLLKSLARDIEYILFKQITEQIVK